MTAPDQEITESAPAEETNEESVPMNRAERRAAAKGKHTPPSGFGHVSGGGQHGRTGGPVGGPRLPRTGHKGG